jgi:hypothetical protein
MSLTSTAPNPQTWTIRLKHHKSTVLIHVEPLLTLSTLKEELLAILNDVAHSGYFNGTKLPSSPSEILLARPVDPLEISLGWEPLEPEDEPEDPFNIDEDAPKGKAKKLESENLKAYGVKDNAVLAFKFKSEKSKGWDVVQAVHIDEYGVENEGDMGVLRDYKG